MKTRTLILSASSALALIAVITVNALHAGSSRRAMDQMTVVIRAEGPSFVLDSYYEGQVRTTKPLSPRDLVPYLTKEVQAGARIIDLTGKVHVVQWRPCSRGDVAA